MTVQEQRRTATRKWGAAIVATAPAVMLAGTAYHPWLGNMTDEHFLVVLAAAVAADTTRWALSHLTIALGSGLLILAFLAIRSYLREAGEERWSALGVPFVVLGSVLFAMLPAFEFAPLAAAKSGGDIRAVQAVLMPLFVPLLLTSGILFIVGVLSFAFGIVRTRVLNPELTWFVAGALVVMAITRLFPLGAALLYVGPVAGVLALWPLAYELWRQPDVQRLEHLVAAQPGQTS